MGLFSWGDKAKAAGEGVEAAGRGVGKVLTGIRTMITGDMPPETVEALKRIELELLSVEQEIQKGQQAIEMAAISKGGFQAFYHSGWRPTLGWTAALSVFCYYVPPIVLQTAFWIRASILSVDPVVFPLTFNMAEIMGLVMSLLGMSGLRTYEKSRSIQGNH